jgi:hypothetical protein
LPAFIGVVVEAAPDQLVVGVEPLQREVRDAKLVQFVVAELVLGAGGGE